MAVSWFADDDTGAAFLGAAGELAGFLLFLAMGASAVFSPIMTDAVNDQSTVALRKINFAWFRWVGGTAVVIGVLQLLYAKQLLALYGEEYEVATSAFIIYLVGFTISAFLLLPMMASQYLVGSRAVRFDSRWLGVCGGDRNGVLGESRRYPRRRNRADWRDDRGQSRLHFSWSPCRGKMETRTDCWQGY